MKERNNPNGYRESDKNLGPHSGMRPDRYPESSMTKDQRADVDRMKKESRYGVGKQENTGKSDKD